MVRRADAPQRYSLLGALLLWWGAGGCEVTEDGPQAVLLSEAEAAVQQSLCERVFSSCRCDQWRWYETQAECDAEVTELVLEIEFALDTNPDLRYDAACMGEYVYLLDSIGCGTTYAAPERCEPPCLVVYGSIPEGQPCEQYGELVSDCAPGLQCFGICTDPCGDEPPELTAGVGEPCLDRPCAEGLLCDFAGEQVCLARPPVGELCVLGECQEGAFCESVDLNDPMSEQRCFAPRPLDEPCRGHMQCTSTYCPAGFCAVAPRQGEACEAGVCAPGLSCVEEICEPADSILCSVGLPGV